jgi:hypothetical protein
VPALLVLLLAGYVPPAGPHVLTPAAAEEKRADPTPPAPAPALTLPAQVAGRAGRYVHVVATVTGAVKGLTWFPVDDGLTVETDIVLKNPNAVLVIADADGTYRLEAVAATDGQVLRAVTKVVVGAPAPPVPPVPPGPTPPVPPVPPVQKADHVLILYDQATEASLPPGQQAVLFGTDMRTFLDQKLPADTDKTHGWRIWTPGLDVSNELPVWKAAYPTTRPASLPWIILTDKAGKVAYSGALPADVAGTQALVTKYAGG